MCLTGGFDYHVSALCIAKDWSVPIQQYMQWHGLTKQSCVASLGFWWRWYTWIKLCHMCSRRVWHGESREQMTWEDVFDGIAQEVVVLSPDSLFCAVKIESIFCLDYFFFFFFQKKIKYISKFIHVTEKYCWPSCEIRKQGLLYFIW